MRKPSTGKILVGPAGWSYADWEGIVYPRSKPRGFHEAAYLAQYFDTIEINTSFYNPLRAEVAESWVEKVQRNPSFQFTAKLWKRFTHERSASLQDEKACKQGLEPLAAAGRLGALLLQFPWSFKNTRENHEYMSGLFMQFMEYPLVVEVRHSSWNQPEIFDWLRAQGVGFCNIDQPVIGRSLAPSEHVTMPVGYVRLHGRNYEHWFTVERASRRALQLPLQPRGAEALGRADRQHRAHRRGRLRHHQQSLSGKSHRQCSATDQHSARPARARAGKSARALPATGRDRAAADRAFRTETK